MSFDRDGAVRDWRKSILSRGGLTVSEVDELEDHLELVEGDMREHLKPYEAFWLAAHRVGTPDALTREFAKVRPNMGWEVRAQWALLGLLVYRVLVPVAQWLLYLLAAALALVPGLSGLAAGIGLFLLPLALLLVFSSVVFVVHRSGASPTAVERVVSRFAAVGVARLGGGLDRVGCLATRSEFRHGQRSLDGEGGAWWAGRTRPHPVRGLVLAR